jgi:hypothetical protein
MGFRVCKDRHHASFLPIPLLGERAKKSTAEIMPLTACQLQYPIQQFSSPQK